MERDRFERYAAEVAAIRSELLLARGHHTASARACVPRLLPKEPALAAWLDVFVDLGCGK
jgi:hypothetical protein